MSLTDFTSLKTAAQCLFATMLVGKGALLEKAVELTHALVVLGDEHRLLTQVITERGINGERDRALRTIRKAVPVAIYDHLGGAGVGWAYRPDGTIMLDFGDSALSVPAGGASTEHYDKLLTRYVSMGTPTAMVAPAAPTILTSAELALRAIKARFDGVFDDPALMACGPLSPNAQDDVQWILANHASAFQGFDQASLNRPVLDEGNEHELD